MTEDEIYVEALRYARTMGEPWSEIAARELQFGRAAMAEVDVRRRQVLVAKFYSDFHELLRRNGIDDSGLGHQEVTFRNLLLPFVRGKRILEIGCGTRKGIPEVLAGMFSRYVGIDVDVDASDDGKIRFVRSNLIGFDSQVLSGEKFDCIYSNDVLEHLRMDDIRSLLATLRSVLAPGAVWLSVTPHRLVGKGDITDRLPRCLRSVVGSHLSVMTSSELAKLFRSIGAESARVVCVRPGITRLLPMISRYLFIMPPALHDTILRHGFDSFPISRSIIMLARFGSAKIERTRSVNHAFPRGT